MLLLHRFSCQATVTLSAFDQNSNALTYFSKTPVYIRNFTDICPLVIEFFYVDRKSNKVFHDTGNILFFCNCTMKAPKNV
jgi:hypothetical protein